MSDFAPSVQAGNGLDPTKRVNYQLGLVLGEDEFRQDQLYHRERDHRATRALHGYGTISGLGVSYDGTLLRVAPGLAADPAGRLICVPTEYCADLDDWLTEKLDDAFDDVSAPPIPGPVTLFVVLCYAECETDEVPLPSESCLTAEESRAASRIMESFELKIVTAPPAVVGEVAPGSLTDLTDTVDAIWGELDPSGGSPPDFDLIADMIRAWVVEHRPEIDGGNACLGPYDDCVLLAQIDVEVAEVAGDGRTASSGVIDEDERPILLSTRFLQEALLRVAPADHEHALDELTDVSSAGAADTQILHFDGGLWQPRDFDHDHPHDHPHEHDLGDLGDVEVEGPSPGDVLTFDDDAEAWVPAAPTGGGGVTAHGDLTDLGVAADHPQYLLVDGSRDLGGDWNAAGNRITALPDSAGAGEAITHGRAAGGDLTGTYPAPTIAAIQGRAVDAAAAESREVLLMRDGVWVTAVPTVLPFATIEAQDQGVFLMWYHLDAPRNRAEIIDRLGPPQLTILAENNAGGRNNVAFSPPARIARNLFLVNTQAGPAQRLLRFVFQLESITVRAGSRALTALEWARENLIWFDGQDGDRDEPTVTRFAINPAGRGIRPGSLVVDDNLVEVLGGTEGGPALIEALRRRQPTDSDTGRLRPTRRPQ